MLNLTVKHLLSLLSSTHAATTFFGSFVVAARNANDSANSFSRWRLRILSGNSCPCVFDSENFISDGFSGVLLSNWRRIIFCSRCAWSIFRHPWEGIADKSLKSRPYTSWKVKSLVTMNSRKAQLLPSSISFCYNEVNATERRLRKDVIYCSLLTT